jgi:hypothetical protein
MRWLQRVPPFAWIVPGTLLVFAGAYVVWGEALYSPGPLRGPRDGAQPHGGVRSHAELANRCSACHVPLGADGTMESRCLECHRDIREEIVSRAPLHGRLAGGERCRDCHTEHRGAQAVITEWSRFDHAATGFALTGKHDTLQCVACHVGHGNRGYEGLTASCASCHAEPQVHLGKFGTDCVACHTTQTWKNVTLPDTGQAAFDHSTTTFPLTGQHGSVKCAACHKANVFKGTPKSCVACHAEPEVHRGKFGTDCVTCHSTTTWKGATLPRELHPFPMHHGNGRRPSACVVCHKDPATYRTYTCYGCHKHEPEKMARKHRWLSPQELVRCVDCHPTGREHKGGDRKERHERRRDDDEDARYLPPGHSPLHARDADLNRLRAELAAALDGIE